MTNTWIFSSNPEKFDLLAEIEAGKIEPGAEDYWQANQRRQDMQPDDIVYHWTTGPQAGIYAVSRIVGEPYEAEIPKWPDHHWWVDLRYEQVLARPLLKADLENHPVLSDLVILHMPRMTNYLLEPEHAQALQQIVDEEMPDDERPQVFRFFEEDCQRYVTKSEHGNWHLWDELLKRLEKEYGHPFRPVPYHRRGDWLFTLWFHPKDTPRPQSDWINQAQLCFWRNIDHQIVSFGLMVERPSVQEIQKDGYTSDRDGNRLVELLQRDAEFANQIDNLVKQHGFSLTAYIWGGEERAVTSAEETLQFLQGISEGQGWGFDLCQTLPCAEAVALGEQVNERIMEAYRSVWPILVNLLPSDVQRALGASHNRRKVVIIGAAAENREQNDQWLPEARQWIADTGQMTDWWSFRPDREYIEQLRGSLPSWIYISYGGQITHRRRIVDFAGPEDQPIVSPWPEHTPPERRGKVALTIDATGTERQTRMWLLIDRIEPLDRPLRIQDFEPIGGKYRSPGQNHFAFVYEPTRQPPPSQPPSDPISSFSAYIASQNFHFPHHLLATYYLSLQTKPFVILSGLSGTGKTKLAQLFAEFISPPVEREVKEAVETTHEQRAALIPVHPDWTDHRGLLGFHHLLTGTYHATDLLRLLLRAYTDPDKHPYFAILDEMNLARVEHYFADFLSVLESRRVRLGKDAETLVDSDPFTLHDHPRCLLAAGNEARAEGVYDADADHKACAVSCDGCPFYALVEEQHRRAEYAYSEAAKGGFQPQHFVPPRLKVPLNVYFTGTVNVDETTFTFSPKVLDRANVIEFGQVDLVGYWQSAESAGDAEPAHQATVDAFSHDLTYPFTTGLREEARKDADLAPYREQLATLLRLLEPYHLHFGYRVADEILVYLLNARRLGDSEFDLTAAFDHAVLQKILPRFHGSRARLWQPLLRLLAFCDGAPTMAEEKAQSWEGYDTASIKGQMSQEPRLPHSVAKLQRMLRDLEYEGFTSFT